MAKNLLLDYARAEELMDKTQTLEEAQKALKPYGFRIAKYRCIADFLDELRRKALEQYEQGQPQP